MKKIYILFALLIVSIHEGNAQLSLTKAFNEFVIGDVTASQGYDSTSAVPKATGAGQNWNFSTLVINTSTETLTYTNTVSTPNASVFPGANISENQGSGSYQHFNITATTREIQGIENPGFLVNFTNTAVFDTWPVSFGYNTTDPFGGATTTGTVTSSIIGTLNVNASGSGTVVMPGGLTLSNCLQVVNTITYTSVVGSATQSAVQREYNYYNGTYKFPVLIVKYTSKVTGTVVTNGFGVKVNTSVVAGIKSYELNNDLSVYPNPVNDLLNLSLTNNSNQEVSITVTNVIGQEIKNQDLGSESVIHKSLNMSDLPKGIYLMNVKIGQTSSVKKFVKE